MKWKCEICGLGPIEVREENLPVRHKCRGAGDPDAWLACVHRGEVLGERECETCGQRGRPVPLYACALHGQCVLRVYSTVPSKMAGDQVCSRCPDRQA